MSGWAGLVGIAQAGLILWLAWSLRNLIRRVRCLEKDEQVLRRAAGTVYRRGGPPGDDVLRQLLRLASDVERAGKLDEEGDDQEG